MTNSPSFHIVPDDVENVYMHDFEIYVDVIGQFEISKLFGNHGRGSNGLLASTSKFIKAFSSILAGEYRYLDDGVPFPMFPFNTDGIDASGKNMTFRRIKVTNFDDAIVAKPGRKGKTYATPCTSDMLVEDCEVSFGVGMSIGSVPPHPNHTCVDNLVFRNVKITHPFKAIYVKTNPGNGTG